MRLVQVVQWLHRFCNFSESVEGLLNNAARTQGADHFKDFRSFKFFGKDCQIGGQWRTVGVMQCHANYRYKKLFILYETVVWYSYVRLFFGQPIYDNTVRSGADGPWHDTHGRHNHDIPMWKDANLLLDYSNFWAPNNRAVMDYIAKPASDDSIRNFELCLASCRNRINNTRHPDRAQEIIQNIQVI